MANPPALRPTQQDTTTGLLLAGIGQVESDGKTKNFAIVDAKVRTRRTNPSSHYPQLTVTPRSPSPSRRHPPRTSSPTSRPSRKSARTLPFCSSTSTLQRRFDHSSIATNRPSLRCLRFRARSILMVRRGCEIDEGGDEEADTDHIVRIHTDPSKDSVLKRVQKVSLGGSVIHTGDHSDTSPLTRAALWRRLTLLGPTTDECTYLLLCYAMLYALPAAAPRTPRPTIDAGAYPLSAPDGSS